MDLSSLSRKELQALCKSNGIPANKTNAFMMDALAKKRIPLSKVDANRIEKSVLKSPLVPRKSISNVNGSGATFTNNFLRRGKRKDPPTSHEIAQEKSNVPRTNAASDLRKLSAGLSQRTKEVKIPSSEVTSSNEVTITSKVNIDERVRTKIDAALCSKVMRAIERPPSAPTPELVAHPDAVADSIEALSHDDAKIGTIEECPEQQMESSRLPDPPANQITKRQEPDRPTMQITKRQEILSTSTSPALRSASLELMAASPRISFSPLVRTVEEKVRNIVERVHSFWKTRELVVVNSFGSPVE